jgi:hypothetical protein
MKKRTVIYASLSAMLLASLACNLAVPASGDPGVGPSAPDLPAASPVQPGAIPAGAGSATPPPLVATVMASQHEMTPANVGAAGALNYDVESSGTGPEHRAPYGDSYNINLFERPFTPTEMNYLPALDINTFQLSEDANWYYISIDLIGGDPNDEMGISFGVELDTDHDGYGDYLVWAQPPYGPDWLAETVQVYQDTNHDTGGASAEKSDAVYPGTGYDKLIFDRGQGDDKDLAWARANPQVSAAIQIAFKRSLAGNAFMWGVWADAGLRDPALFNYNDRYLEEQAGSPEKSEKYYPISSIAQVDNTCWPAYGFKPLGYEPHLCPSLEPRPTKQKQVPTPQDPGCVPWWVCLDLDIVWPKPLPPVP